MMRPYDPIIEQAMRQFYGTLSEKDKRRYAAVEAVKLGRGAITYIAQVLGCNRHTVANGIAELKGMPEQTSYDPRIRRCGGGRKRYDETYPDIDAKFLEVLRDHTAGDPMDEQVLWTDLTPGEIADWLAERYGIRVSKTVIRQLLDKHHYRRRKAQKNAR